MAIAVNPSETMSLNLPENSDSAQQQSILDALPALVFLEREGRIVFANAEARQMLGLAGGEWIQRPVVDVLWGLVPGTAEPQALAIGSRRGNLFRATLPARNGQLLPIEGVYSIVNADLREAVIVAYLSGQERAPKSRLMEDVLSSIPEAVVIVHDNHVLYTNPAFTCMFGYSAEEASGASLAEMIVPETRRHEQAMLEKSLGQQGRATLDTVRMNKRGELVDVVLQAAPLLVDGAWIGYVHTYRDIGDRKQTEAKLQHDAMHDMLTGLPNRALFLDRLTLALSRRSRFRDRSCGVLFVDMDHFKEINDTQGHAAGDMLLVMVADRLRATLRPQDSASRLGGDEFAVLVENIVEAGDLSIVANRVLSEMERPFEIFGRSVQCGASIGVALAGPDHTTPEMLIRDADFAMYRAKQDGGGRIEIFDKRLEVHFASHKERERELRLVLDNHQFEVWYQPVYRLGTGKLEGFESVLRWRRVDGTSDSFHDLLSVAEETGLSITLGRETINAVCRQLQAWLEGWPQNELTVTINVTHRQFYDPDLVAQLKNLLAVNAVDPPRLLFDVSETTLNENPDAAVAILQRMVDCNVRIAVGNFGSSLAPLSQLVRLPIDVLKLAPQLTTAATNPGRQQLVLESLIQLGHKLGMQVVAQGIETAAQLDALCRMGCELGEGPLLSHALEPARASQLMGAAYRRLHPVPEPGFPV